jgi:hypothetical protein
MSLQLIAQTIYIYRQQRTEVFYINEIQSPHVGNLLLMDSKKKASKLFAHKFVGKV